MQSTFFFFFLFLQWWGLNPGLTPAFLDKVPLAAVYLKGCLKVIFSNLKMLGVFDQMISTL
jgi:hypothetical protein